MRKAAVSLLLGIVFLSGCDRRTNSAEDAELLAAAGVAPSLFGSGQTVQDSSPMVVRRLWSTPALEFWGSPSPDGRYLSYVDRTTGDVALHDFHTGENRRVTSEGAATRDELQQAVLSRFSPDGEHIAYGWIRKGCDELRVISVNGGESRLLYRDESADVNPEEWSDDGRFLLVNIGRHDASRQLGLVSVSDGSLRMLKTFPAPATYIFETTISSDGRFVIYDWPASADGEARDIYVVDVEDGREHVLVDHPADDRVLGFTPDGRNLLFASDRSGTMGAWLLPVSEGQAAGEPTLVKPELWRARPLGFDAGGSFYYGVNSATSDVQVAGIDLETGRLLEAPAPTTNRFTGSNHDAVWSPDGRYLAYLSDRSSVPDRVGSTVLVIRSTDSGEHRELQPPLFQPSRLDWSLDGRSLLVQAADAYNKGQGLYRIDAMTGGVEPLVLWPADSVAIFGSWARNSHELLLLRLFFGDAGIDNERSQISVLDLQNGDERSLAEHNVYWPAVSIDRQWVAFTEETGESTGELRVLPVAGGEPRTLLKFQLGTEWPLYLVWGPDGRHVYYQLRGEGGQSGDDAIRGLWRVPVAGGEPQKLGWATEEHLRGAGLRFQPGGNRIALVHRRDGAEVWVMENFLPSTEPRS